MDNTGARWNRNKLAKPAIVILGSSWEPQAVLSVVAFLTKKHRWERSRKICLVEPMSLLRPEESHSSKESDIHKNNQSFCQRAAEKIPLWSPCGFSLKNPTGARKVTHDRINQSLYRRAAESSRNIRSVDPMPLRPEETSHSSNESEERSEESDESEMQDRSKLASMKEEEPIDAYISDR
jgi:hypothetical protein